MSEWVCSWGRKVILFEWQTKGFTYLKYHQKNYVVCVCVYLKFFDIRIEIPSKAAQEFVFVFFFSFITFGNISLYFILVIRFWNQFKCFVSNTKATRDGSASNYNFFIANSKSSGTHLFHYACAFISIYSNIIRKLYCLIFVFILFLICLLYIWSAKEYSVSIIIL